MNAIVVREFRQAVRSKAVAGVLLLTLTVLCAGTFNVLMSASGYYGVERIITGSFSLQSWLLQSPWLGVACLAGACLMNNRWLKEQMLMYATEDPVCA